MVEDESISEQTVFLVDDDEAMRKALTLVLTSSGYAVESFAGPAAFLARIRPEHAGCLLADIRMPHIGGLDLQRQLRDLGILLPIVFVSGYPDIALGVRAIKAGALDFLIKPVREHDLLDAVAAALLHDRRQRPTERERARLAKTFDDLDEREKEVMRQIADGRMNKIIAGDLGVSEITVKVVRSRTMRKMGATSLAHFIRMAEKLGLG